MKLFALWRTEKKRNNRRNRIAARKLQRELRALRKRRSRLLHEFERSVVRGESSDLQSVSQQLQDVVVSLQILKKVLPRRSTSVPNFVFSSRILRRSFEVCTGARDEGMHFLLGVELDGVLVATEVAECAYRERSITNARLDHNASHNLVVAAHEQDHKIIGLFHSQPGRGALATTPSPEDMRTHELWSVGRDFISGIWSRDGYLRFVSHEQFKVEVVGTHLEEVDENLFRFKQKGMEE